MSIRCFLKLNIGLKISLGSLKAIFVKVSQNFIKSHLRVCLISRISAHSLWQVCSPCFCFLSLKGGKSELSMTERPLALTVDIRLRFNPVALKTAKTLWSFGRSECNRVKPLFVNGHGCL